MAKQYLTFVERLDNLPEGKEVELLVKDLTPGRQKYDARFVRAIISRQPQPGGDTLVVRGLVGLPYPGDRGIRIVKEVGELPSNYGKQS
ncbi:MAG: phenylphosphate carboxylase subunit gamma [Chloroflexi bacterium]|nr:phenylphosphate carboxylase subunit gamma [Chloroflexota bacterium]